MDKWKLKAKLEKLCIDCGTALEETVKIQRCSVCNKKHIERANNRIKNVRRKPNSGMCHQCGKKSSKRICDECKAKNKKYHIKYDKKKYENYKKNGVCVKCGAKRLLNQLVCEVHYFRNISKASTGTEKNWKELKTKLEVQKNKCFYTNDKLILGINTSIDHIIPKSKNGNNNLENLVWCTLEVNLAKRNLDDKSFVELCKKVLNNYGCWNDNLKPVELLSLDKATKQEAIGTLAR